MFTKLIRVLQGNILNQDYQISTDPVVKGIDKREINQVKDKRQYAVEGTKHTLADARVYNLTFAPPPPVG